MPRSRQQTLGGLVATAVVGAGLFAPVALASAGGAAVPQQPGGGGGTEYGAVLAAAGRPVASRFRVAPARVVAGGRLPGIALRVDEPGVAQVRARVVLLPVDGSGAVVRIDLGQVRTGAILRPAFPSGTALVAGRYLVRVHASDPAGRTLRRTRSASGRLTLTVVPKPTPTPKPLTPVAPPSVPVVPAPLAAAGAAGTFPVVGAHTYGEGFGVDRGDHVHQGVDVLAAEGLPVVAPTAGTVRFTDYQARAAGEYVVMHSAGGPDFFFAHCVRGSTAVKPGQAVTEGQPLCHVGTTGDARGAHLHFELWPNGWRTGARDSLPADPLAQLRAWDR